MRLTALLIAFGFKAIGRGSQSGPRSHVRVFGRPLHAHPIENSLLTTSASVSETSDGIRTTLTAHWNRPGCEAVEAFKNGEKVPFYTIVRKVGTQCSLSNDALHLSLPLGTYDASYPIAQVEQTGDYFCVITGPVVVWQFNIRTRTLVGVDSSGKALWEREGYDSVFNGRDDGNVIGQYHLFGVHHINSATGEITSKSINERP
jgi:hypothetical protein